MLRLDDLGAYVGISGLSLLVVRMVLMILLVDPLVMLWLGIVAIGLVWVAGAFAFASGKYLSGLLWIFASLINVFGIFVVSVL